MADLSLSLLIGTIQQQQMGTEGNVGMRVRGQGVIFFLIFFLSAHQKGKKEKK
jgi:hypothetical protein